MTIGEIIKNRRKELGMSAEDIAEIIGTSPATIYRYESNYITKMGIDKLTPIAKALKVSEAYLMGWTSDPNWRPDSDISAPSSMQLTEQEKWLIDTYRELDKPQRERLLAYIEGLLDAGSLKNHLYESPVVNEFMNCYDSPSGLMVAEPMSEYTSESQYKPVTIAAHHDSDEWSEDELKEIEDIKKYAKSKKK